MTFTSFPIQLSLELESGERVIQHATNAYSWAMPVDIEGKIERVEKTLTQVMRKGIPLAISWSAGKDSSALLCLSLSAAAKMAAVGESVPPIVITFADTMIENPEQVLYAKNEMVLVRSYAEKHGLNVSIETSYPNLTDQWAVRTIGGRGLPPFPGTNRDCTVNWKISPMQKLRKRVLKRLSEESIKGKEIEPVVLLGTRYEESQERARNMRERGESDIEIRRGLDESGKPTDLFMSPLCWWTTDDVWEMLGYARAGVIDSYSNFEETFRVYADAMGTSCVIVAEDMSKTLNNKKACGARMGCSLCTLVGKDASMENMLAHDDRYAYMKGLNRLRNFLVDTRWDMDRRSWIGRTINQGYIKIAPDAYSPRMMEELLRYALTIDVVEQRAARASGLSTPRFQLVNVEQLFAIDAMWSLQAFQSKPFHALKLWDDVYNKGKRYEVPEVLPFARPKDLPARYLYVGANWDEGDRNTYTGLRSAIAELVAADGTGCQATRILSNGKEVMDINTGPMLEFDPETALFILDDVERLLREHHDNPRSLPTQAYHYYAQLGFMSVKAGMEGEIDTMLRRSNFKIRKGLAGQIDPAQVWASAVSAEEAGLVANMNGKLRKRGVAGSRSTVHTSIATEPQLAGAIDDGTSLLSSPAPGLR